MKLIDKIENSFSDSAFAALLLGLFAGIIIGFIASPIKNGIGESTVNVFKVSVFPSVVNVCAFSSRTCSVKREA